MTCVIVPIVEGHGEEAAVPHLIRRISGELCSRWDVEVSKPIRQPRSRLLMEATNSGPGYLEKAIRLAELKLAQRGGRGFVLVLVDADDDCPAKVVGDLLPRLGPNVSLVLPNPEFETWFAASAEALDGLLNVDAAPETPERDRLGKAWVRHRFARGRYSESVDQVRLAHRIDLAFARERSPSFDKLCREVERRLAETPPD
ncbi:MAG: DUF4276 family protein [Planctomycetota bacterium JB042]